MKKILLTLLCTLLPLLGWAQENEPYAVLSDDNTVLTFYYDNHKAERNGMSVGPFHVNGSPSFVEQSWYAERETITTVVFDVSFAACPTLTSTSYWFTGCYNLATIFGLENLNTEKLTSMSYMFSDCYGLKNIDLSVVNMENVADMRGMFYGCKGLTSLDLSSFNTGNVTDMSDMFCYCWGLTSLNLSGFNTSNVTDMGGMFCDCSNLMNIDMNGFNTENVTSMEDMFRGCSNLTNLDLSGFNTSNVTDMSALFNRCSSLTNLDVSGFKTDNVTDMSYMFAGCSGLTNLNLSNFNTSNVTDMSGMFSSCSGLTNLDLSNFNTFNVMNMEYMFRDCDLTSLDLSSFNTSNVTNMNYMFYNCRGLKSINLSSFNTSNVTDMSYMFYNCKGLTNLDLSGFNTSNVTAMGHMFYDCKGLANLDLSGFNTSNITGMSNMFYGCSGLKSLDLSGFNTENVTSMYGMFYGCSGMTSLDLSSFNTSNVTSTSSMFFRCSDLTTIYVSEEWNTTTVASSNGMFAYCSNLVGGKGTKYQDDHVDYIYARIDQGPGSDAPGYFTRSSDKPTFDGRVLTVRGFGSIDAVLAQIGGFEQVNKTITAIVWEADVPYSGEVAFSNPNLLFYANDATKGQAINNLIYNGVAESITLTDEGEGNIDFYCPQSFTARSITYKRSFQQQTEIGVSRGWETIALPFTVQRIGRVRSDGEGQDRITPFGSSVGDRHFWLRRLTANGLQGVQTIEANTPYIIAMPNSEEYATYYNLAGDIVFTAENATVAVTEPVSDRSTDYELTASFERMAAQDSVYVLNVGTPRYGYAEGSIFEAGYRDLQPFRAYTRHINNGRPAPPYFALGELGGNSTTGISSVGHDTFETDVWYDIQGRKLQGRPTQKGVHIQNGRKVIIK